jgi:UDP-glucose 4-epimerase
VYGPARSTPVREDDLTAPLTPYGLSKLMTENMLTELSRACPGFQAVSLRYFNVAGADLQGRAGRRRCDGAGLIDRAVEAALGHRPFLDIWGDDYETRDGAGERDYIHVSDVADAHIAAMRYLEGGGPGVVLNCASGRGYTVLEVLAALETIVRRPIPRRAGPRRVGDVPTAVANVERLSATLGWRPRFANLDVILQSALNWRGRSED